VKVYHERQHYTTTLKRQGAEDVVSG
jgi:hypothetical protein